MRGWVGSCPIEGTCAECGLTFEWGRLLRPVLAGLDWCVEFAPATRRRRAVLKTWWRALRPGSFYRALRMTLEVRRRRLLLFATCLLAATYLSVAATQTWMAWQSWQRGSQFATQPAAFSRVAAHVVFTPWSSKRITAPGGWAGRGVFYASPRDLNRRIAVPVAWLAGATALAAAPPLLLLALPISMRLARVRPRHLLRIGAYNASWVPIVALTEMTGAMGLVTDRPQLVMVAVVVRVVVWPAIMASSWLALKRYLRLREKTVVAVTLVTAVLAALAATTVVSADALAAPITLVLRAVLGL